MYFETANISELTYARLMHAFERRTLPAAAWTHAAHLAVALWYLRENPRDRATELIRTGIQRHNATNGKGLAYHETITLAWIEIIARFLADSDRDATISELLGKLLERCGDKDHLLRYYSPALLFSDAARAAWTPPDVADFR